MDLIRVKIAVFGGEEERVIGFAVLEEGLIFEGPTEDVKDGLDEGVFEAGFVFVFGEELFLLVIEGGEFVEGGVGGGLKGRAFRFEGEAVFKPVVGEEVGVAECA